MNTRTQATEEEVRYEGGPQNLIGASDQELYEAATAEYWVVPINTDNPDFCRCWQVVDVSQEGLVAYAAIPQVTKKRWPFQATVADKRLIDAINAARPLDRTTVADGIRYALRFTATNDQEVKAMEIRTILYQYSADDAGMFGPDADLGEVDIPASYNAYEDAVLAVLKAAYPAARVSVQSGPDMTRVNDESDHGEIPWIDEAVHQAWVSFDWVVSK